jgi:hypothetical protein
MPKEERVGEFRLLELPDGTWRVEKGEDGQTEEVGVYISRDVALGAIDPALATASSQALHEQRIRRQKEAKERIRKRGSPYTGRFGRREELTAVGTRGERGVACPRCGASQFTAKRSMAGKTGFGVLAPKTMVRCVACGLMFKRG